MKRMSKFGPRYGMKRFEEGGKVPGMTSYAESGSAGGSDMSFSEAFKAARAVAKREGRDPDKEEFTWKGKKYKAEIASDKSKKSEEKKEEASVNFATQGRKPTVDFAREGRVKPKAPEVGEPTQAMRDEARYKVRSQKAPGRPGGGRPRSVEDVYSALRKNPTEQGFKRGGSVSSASRRADGIAKKGKTRGKMC
jgi:hypothetical protein